MVQIKYLYSESKVWSWKTAAGVLDTARFWQLKHFISLARYEITRSLLGLHGMRGQCDTTLSCHLSI